MKWQEMITLLNPWAKDIIMRMVLCGNRFYSGKNSELLPVFNHSKFHFRYSSHEADKQTEAE